MESKKCKSCSEEKSISEYYFRKDSGKYGSLCKKCVISGKRVPPKDPENKVCKHCGVSKPFSEYQKTGGGAWLQPYCKPCDAERKRKWSEDNSDVLKEKRAKYYAGRRDEIISANRIKYKENREEILRKSKEYRDKNKERINARVRARAANRRDFLNKRAKEYRESKKEHYLKVEAKRRANRTKEKRERDLSMQRAWHHRNRERSNKRSPEKMIIRREQKRVWCNRMAKTDPKFKILKNLRSRARFALMKDGAVKSSTTEELLGCSIPDFYKYFESKFTDGMSWSDFMNGDIHIDHKIPCVKFDLTDEKQQKECFHYTNLQPLWKVDNLIKGTKVI